jgi:hypothetical protein
MSVLWLRMRHYAITLVTVMALLLGGVSLSTNSTTVQAKNAYEFECTYYDDNGEICGEFWYHCYGSYQWGVRTANEYCVQGDDCHVGIP